MSPSAPMVTALRAGPREALVRIVGGKLVRADELTQGGTVLHCMRSMGVPWADAQAAVREAAQQVLDEHVIATASKAAVAFQRGAEILRGEA